jgi:hypothetical protein
MLLLSRTVVARLMDFTDYVDAVEAGFRAAATGQALAPPAAAFHVPGGSYHAKAAALLAGDPPLMAIKLNGNYPGNPAANGLPTVQGVIYLADATNGRPLALMDSVEITINRTGAATTLAARHLARRDSRVATICGAGVQGRIQARAIVAAARLDTIHVWDIRPDAAEKLARELTQELKIDVRPSADLMVTRQSAPSLDPERLLAAADREPLREQLRRGAAAPERHHRAARIARLSRKTPGYVINGLKREELVALNSTLLHELYFASLGGDGSKVPPKPTCPKRSRATSAR